MKHLTLIFVTVLLLGGSSLYAQLRGADISFYDAESKAPLGKVSVVDKYGSVRYTSDSTGAIHFTQDRKQGQILIAVLGGYEPDTLPAGEYRVFLQPLRMNLEAATIHASKTYRVLNEPMEYVVDYTFTGDNILVATYSGDNGGHAKLFLTDKQGTVISRETLPAEPESLFCSCAGKYYCVCKDAMYPITIGPKCLTVDKPYNRRLYPLLAQCEQSIAGNRYYKIADKINFEVKYEMIENGDSVFRPITRFGAPDVAVASRQEYFEILALLEKGDTHEAARVQLLRNKWDRGSFAHFDLPIFHRTDTLLFFDFINKQVLFYSLRGKLCRRVPIGFMWNELQQFSILEDEVTERIYIHRYGNAVAQTIEELNLADAMVTVKKIYLTKPVAENVKIHGGRIYQLWQNHAAHATRHLFVQIIE